VISNLERKPPQDVWANIGGTTNAVMTCPARTRPDDTVHLCVRFDRQASCRRPPVVRSCPRGMIPWCECSTRCNDTCGMGRCLTRGTSAASRVGSGGCRGSSSGWPRTPTSGRGGGVPHAYRARLPGGTDQHRRCRIDRAPGGRQPMVRPSPLAGRPRGAPRLRPTLTRVFNEAWAPAWRPWVLGVRTPAG
jgi:hypothetical protein